MPITWRGGVQFPMNKPKTNSITDDNLPVNSITVDNLTVDSLTVDRVTDNNLLDINFLPGDSLKHLHLNSFHIQAQKMDTWIA